MEDGSEELISELRAEQWENSQESSRGAGCKETQQGEDSKLSDTKAGNHSPGSCNPKEGNVAGSQEMPRESREQELDPDRTGDWQVVWAVI